MNKYYRKAKKIKLSLDRDRRLIFISDIHGNYSLFTRLLSKINFSDNDYLFILGDFIEKGKENLKTLRYIIELTKKGNVFPLMGNCDDIYFRDIVSIRSEEMFLNYALNKGNSVINEMADELNIKITKDSNVKEICNIFTKKYQDLIQFLDTLPHIIEIEKFYLVHAGINDINDDNAYGFMHAFTLENNLDKYIISGHDPVINSQYQVPLFNPIINHEERIISIDGGNNVNPYGQLNALIIDSLDNMNISYTYVDEFPIIKLNKSYQGSKSSINIVHNYNVIKILEKRDKYCVCQYLSSTLPIFNSDIYLKNGKYRCRFGTNYFFNLKEGEEVSLLNESKDFLLIKKDGKVGFAC